MNIGTRSLVTDATLHVDKGSAIGLVGRNGAGKTTLLRLLAGEGTTSEVVEYGGLISRKGSIGYLAQDPRIGDPTQMARDRILSVRGIERMLRSIQRAEHDMSTLTHSKQEKAMEKYVRLDMEFTAAGGYAAKSEASQIAASLGLDEQVLDQELQTLSGGQRRRVELTVYFSQVPKRSCWTNRPTTWITILFYGYVTG